MLTAREERALLTITADTPATDPALSAALRLRARDHETIELDLQTGCPGRSPCTAVPRGGRRAGVGQCSGYSRCCAAPISPWCTCTERVPSTRHSSPGDATAFADAYPVTLASAASLERLRGWVTETALERGEEPGLPLAVERFRPNLVVDGDLEPFEEDRWRA